MSNNTDIYRLVEEMNKAKAKKEVNDIFSMLDEVQKENNISVDDIRNSVNRTDGVAYVNAQRSALEKYYKEIKSNPKDIAVVEGHVNDEINSIDNRSTLEEKGYYDGLYYVLRAIKKAKSEVAYKINNKLREKLG